MKTLNHINWHYDWKKSMSRGFKILIIMASIVLILSAIIVPQFLESSALTRIKRTQKELLEVGAALEEYKSKNGKYPSDLLALTSPVEYLTSSSLQDVYSTHTATGYEFLTYWTGSVENEGVSKEAYMLWSAGPDEMRNIDHDTLPELVKEACFTSTARDVFVNRTYDPSNGINSVGGDIWILEIRGQHTD